MKLTEYKKIKKQIEGLKVYSFSTLCLYFEVLGKINEIENET